MSTVSIRKKDDDMMLSGIGPCFLSDFEKDRTLCPSGKVPQGLQALSQEKNA
jgi:hypothetical protein